MYKNESKDIYRFLTGAWIMGWLDKSHTMAEGSSWVPTNRTTDLPLRVDLYKNIHNKSLFICSKYSFKLHVVKILFSTLQLELKK